MKIESKTTMNNCEHELIYLKLRNTKWILKRSIFWEKKSFYKEKKYKNVRRVLIIIMEQSI